MADYWQVKRRIIEVLGWWTRDENFAAQYLKKYNASTRLDNQNLGVTPTIMAFMPQSMNEQVGPLVPGWANLGSIDLANCGAKTVGEFIEFICEWGGVQIPEGEPT